VSSEVVQRGLGGVAGDTWGRVRAWRRGARHAAGGRTAGNGYSGRCDGGLLWRDAASEHRRWRRASPRARSTTPRHHSLASFSLLSENAIKVGCSDVREGGAAIPERDAVGAREGGRYLEDEGLAGGGHRRHRTTGSLAFPVRASETPHCPV
jgi:hypothetical protein